MSKTTTNPTESMIKNMVKEVNAELITRGENFTVSFQKSEKPCGDECGIRIDTGTSTQPVFYPDITSTTPDEISALTDRIIDIRNQNLNVDFDIHRVMTSEYVKDNVYPRFIRKEFADKLDQNDTYYIPWNDLYIIFYITVNAPTGDMGTITLNKPFLDQLKDINPNDLYDIAVSNLENNMTIQPIGQVLMQMMGGGEDTPFDDVFGPKMYVATNTNTQYGATVMLTNTFKEQIHKIFGDTAMIIPSSVHEIIIIENNDVNEIANMIKEVNQTQLAAKDILEDHPYYFYANAEGQNIVDVRPVNIPKTSSEDDDSDVCLDIFETND